ncbi:MAG: magnesium transporter CorA family protein [Acidobacteria bacterium]|nr:magnesium transporter CorA family protein [Acidobacteriota bacterium]
MLTAYLPNGEGITARAAEPAEPPAGAALWLDLLDPTPEEVAGLSRVLPVELPTREDMQEIEASSRLYTEGEALVMSLPVVHRSTTEQPESSVVSFILLPGRLVTLRYADPLPFGTFARRLARQPGAAGTADQLLAGLLEAICDRLADILEQATGDLERLSHRVFSASPGDPDLDLKDVLRQLGRAGDLATKARESLLGLGRIAMFFATKNGLAKDVRTRIKTLHRDVASITDHAGFLAHKVNFLLDATLGMINIEQNNIIKIFTVAAVAFLPPTLIASIYGMNFHVFPELGWRYGYVFALVLMVVSAVLPFWYFRRRGWL